MREHLLLSRLVNADGEHVCVHVQFDVLLAQAWHIRLDLELICKKAAAIDALLDGRCIAA